MEFNEAKQNFIQAWGSLGSSWGINKAMAQIHALLLIAPEPMTTDDIMEGLSMSRGNVNMNIRALMDWGIVHKVFMPGERKEYFKSEKDMWKMVRQIAQGRKKKEIEPVIRFFESLNQVKPEKSKEFDEFVQVTDDLESLVGKMDSMLDKFLRADEHWFYGTVQKMMK